MIELLALVPAFPLAGFIVLAAAGNRLSARGVATVGAGSVGLAFLAALLVAAGFDATAPSYRFTQVLWTWMEVGDLHPRVAFHLDPLSLVMMLVVTGVGFLIHVYSTEYMRGDDGYARFFAYMNLFVASMLVLVLADNLPLLYLGWEGVGLCSYLLIGFWYRDPSNVRAANKAFIVTRIGDTALILGLFLLFLNLRTLDIQPLLESAESQWTVGSTTAAVAALLLLGGAVGKSGQLPLQVWLPDAMAGPTPVSALIHAATMVTAGVYLIARMHVVFAMAPSVQFLVGVVGAITLLLAGFSALAQRDIKRILAYSTISQIGYMFLALGVGAWPAAIFHFTTHAFFKALLFMAAGAIILSLHHEQDIFRMGGLRKQLPLVFWTFLAGAMSLAALPLVTAGFYSKDMILWSALTSPGGSFWLWVAGAAGAFVTALYTFRMVFIVFFGPPGKQVEHPPNKLIQVPLLALAVLALVGGFLELPRTLGHLPLFSTFLLLPGEYAHTAAEYSFLFELGHQLLIDVLCLGGVYLAYRFFLLRPAPDKSAAAAPWGAKWNRLWEAGWGFDWVYEHLIVLPFVALARANRADYVGRWYGALVLMSAGGSRILSLTQSGRLRWYMMGIAAGAVITIALAVLL